MYVCISIKPKQHQQANRKVQVRVYLLVRPAFICLVLLMTCTFVRRWLNRADANELKDRTANE